MGNEQPKPPKQDDVVPNRADLDEALGHALRNMPTEKKDREDYVEETFHMYEAEVQNLPKLKKKKDHQKVKEPWYPF